MGREKEKEIMICSFEKPNEFAGNPMWVYM